MTRCWWRLTHPARVTSSICKGEKSALMGPGRRASLDDFGLKALRPPGPEDLYDVINERYEKASIALTSNRDRSEWPDLFGDALLASAALDRLTHGAHFVEITGPSFRAEATKRQVTTRRARAAN